MVQECSEKCLEVNERMMQVKMVLSQGRSHQLGQNDFPAGISQWVKSIQLLVNK